MRTITLPNEAIHSGSLVLVNSHCPIHERKNDISLVSVDESSSDVLLERQSARFLEQLIDEIGARGSITAVSGWRSRAEQSGIYASSLAKDGPEFTKKYVALPGCSEHQTGLAIDLAENKPEIDFIRPDFPYSGICGTFRQKAAAFGFVERYPKGRENLTEIAWEPWHFRYVGFPHADVMQQRGFTLEEYHDFLKGFVFGINPFVFRRNGRLIEVAYLKANDDDVTSIEIAEGLPFTISGNNTDGFIVTIWR